MTSHFTLNELGESLKKRRSELSPRTVGLPSARRPRRGEGLRREEVARLAGKITVRTRRRGVRKAQPQLRRVRDDLTSAPAMVQGRRGDIPAWNALAAALVTDCTRVPAKHRDHPRLLFTDPAMRSPYAGWETVAQATVTQLRMARARSAAHPRLPGRRPEPAGPVRMEA
ncbi:hypothetical protein [Streptomyces swartbergensis]|uniref:MmyB family transcriptional regulator n=1 Tax=Streptomyces swartbergensis TaxID=487165 RepID=UPI003CC628AD